MPSIIPETGAPSIHGLIKVHPWYAEMMDNEMWPARRAVFGNLDRQWVKEEYLIQGEFESGYADRVALSQFLGVAESIKSAFAGHVFTDEIITDYGGNADLEEWAGDVDGQALALDDYLERIAPEVIGMGGVGVWLDAPSRQGVMPENRAQEEALGLRAIRPITFHVEQIRNWGEDDQGVLEWLVLMRGVTEDMDPLGKDQTRAEMAEWIVMDRERVAVYRAPIEGQSVIHTSHIGPHGLPLVKEAQQFGDVVTHREPVEHGAGRVPFEFIPGMRLGTMQGDGFLNGSVRADLVMFNEDSDATWSRKNHAHQDFFIRSDKQLEEVVKDTERGFHLSAADGEEIGYAGTDSGAFSTQMESVEARKLDGYRQAGADPTGMFDGRGGQAESGTAKRQRFQNTEARTLKLIAAQLQRGHQGILEVVSRLLSSETPSYAVRHFEGSVQYPSRFETRSADELIQHYAESKGWFDGVLDWHHHMLTRIALATAGEVSEETRKAIVDQIEALTMEEIKGFDPREAFGMGAAQGGAEAPGEPESADEGDVAREAEILANA